jgi:hypothetical protein
VSNDKNLIAHSATLKEPNPVALNGGIGEAAKFKLRDQLN